MSSTRTCWDCKSETSPSGLFCDSCGKIQKESSSNMFSLLGLEPQFKQDQEALEQSYFKAQSQTHPDRFVRSSDQEKLFASHNAVEINSAFQTLKDPLKRAEHLLALSGFEFESQTTQEPALLIEMMNLQEQLEENPETTGPEIEQKYEFSLREISKAFLDKDFHNAKKSLDRLKFLSRILEGRQ